LTLFRGRIRSRQPLRHIRHWISRKTVRDTGFVPKDHQGTNRKWSIGNPSQSCDYAMTLRDPERSKTRDHNTITRAQYIRKQLETQFGNNR